MVSILNKSPNTSTNWLLNKINNNHDSKCYFCKIEIETVQNMFWNCEKVKLSLAEFQNSLKRSNVQLNFTKETYIFGLHHNSTNILDNRIIL